MPRGLEYSAIDHAPTTHNGQSTRNRLVVDGPVGGPSQGLVVAFQCVYHRHDVVVDRIDTLHIQELDSAVYWGESLVYTVVFRTLPHRSSQCGAALIVAAIRTPHDPIAGAKGVTPSDLLIGWDCLRSRHCWL